MCAQALSTMSTTKKHKKRSGEKSSGGGVRSTTFFRVFWKLVRATYGRGVSSSFRPSLSRSFRL